MDSKTLGARIRNARKKIGLSQEELAEAVSKDQVAISAYENGDRRISAIDIPVFAKALNVSLLYFFQDEVASNDIDDLLLAEFHQLPGQHAQAIVLDVIASIKRNMK